MAVERNGADVHLRPIGALAGEVRLPGSKSLTNRYLLCTALADGQSVLNGASLSDDGRRMVAGLEQLGVDVQIDERRNKLTVHGCRGHLPADDAELDVGDAGTVARFLTALACLGFGRYRMDGSPRMRERPIGPLIDALHELGAQIGYDLHSGFLPVTIVARGLRGGQVEFVEPPSSQYLSALLMIAPYAKQDVLISIDGPLVSRPYVDMTIDVIRSLGVELLEAESQRFIVPASQRYRGGEIGVEPDASAATYFWAMAAVTGGRVRISGLSPKSRQGDVRFAGVLEQMGCGVTSGDFFIEVQGPAQGQLKGITIDLNTMPDTVQTLAVAALFADGPTEVNNVANLRIKETDRLDALGSELTRLGAQVELRPDGLTIVPPGRITPAAIETYGDHRMAMAFAVAGMAAAGMTIKDAACVSKSFPDFFEVLAMLAAGRSG